MDLKSKVFGTIVIGNFQSKDLFMTALRGSKFLDWRTPAHRNFKYTFNEMKLQQQELELELALVTVANLGFTGSTQYAEILSTAKILGLKRCPAETAGQMVIKHILPAAGGSYILAMTPLPEDDGYPAIFEIAQTGPEKYCILPLPAKDDDFSSPEAAFIFATSITWVKKKKR
jgi:hypothetical protein